MPQARPHKLLGVLWILGAIAVPVATVAFTFAIAAAIGVVSNLFVIFTLPVAIFMAKRGRRHFGKVGEQYLDRDPRPPVVFLREFGEERSIMEDTSESQGSTFEQKLVDAFETLGPVVAIGRPGENLPPSGSIRIYVDDEHWQAKVAELIERSSLIVIQARGRSDGMFWELDHVFKRVPFKPTVLAFPFEHVLSPRERYLDFRESLEKTTGIQIPYETSQYIYFESPDAPVPVLMPELVVARLAPEAFAKRVRLRARMNMILQVSLAMLGVYLLIVAVVSVEETRFYSASLFFLYITAVLAIAVLQAKWGAPLVLALTAAYAVLAYALAADKLPGLASSDAFVFAGISLVLPLVFISMLIWRSLKARRNSDTEDETVSVFDRKHLGGNPLRFAVIPVAALAAWLCVHQAARVFVPATNLTDTQLLQLAPIERQIFAAANENQCEQMLIDRIHRHQPLPFEDALSGIANEFHGYRSTQQVLATLPRQDAATYEALRDSAVSQEPNSSNDPSMADLMNDTATKISDPSEEQRFTAVSGPLKGEDAPPGFNIYGAFCSVVKTMTLHEPDLPQKDILAVTRFLNF